MWSKLEITFQSFLNPASYESTPIYFITLKSSSYFSWDIEDYLSHFLRVSIYDFCNEEPSAERILLSLSSSLISYWIRIISLLTWFAIMGSAWLISKTLRYYFYLSLIPEGGLRRLRFLNPVELFMRKNCYILKSLKKL